MESIKCWEQEIDQHLLPTPRFRDCERMRTAGWGQVLLKAVFWTWRGYCTHGPCTRLNKAKLQDVWVGSVFSTPRPSAEAVGTWWMLREGESFLLRIFPLASFLWQWLAPCPCTNVLKGLNGLWKKKKNKKRHEVERWEYGRGIQGSWWKEMKKMDIIIFHWIHAWSSQE